MMLTDEQLDAICDRCNMKCKNGLCDKHLEAQEAVTVVALIGFTGRDGLVHNGHTAGRNRKTCPACWLLRLKRLYEARCKELGV